MYFLKYVPLKKELLIIAGVFGVLLLLPILAVTTILSNGIGAVSGALVDQNPVNHEITVYNPDGSVKLTIQASTVWPVHGTVTLEFGVPDPPFLTVHPGIDIGVPIGTPVGAFMDGTVSKTGTDASEGNFVYVNHGNGIESHYLHLSQILTSVGTNVVAGQELGLSGSTGWSTGPHLHFQINVDSIPVNPREFMVGNP